MQAPEWECDRLEATSTRSRAEAPGFYAALGYEDLSGRQARYARGLAGAPDQTRSPSTRTSTRPGQGAISPAIGSASSSDGDS